MLYRKSSPNPSTLLLRIVATAGASALLGVSACSDAMGVVPDAGGAGNPAPCGGGPCGSVVMPPDGGDASPDAGADAQGLCGGHVCGVLVMPPDAGDASPDAGADAQGPCGGHVCGILAMPPDAGDADASPSGPADSGSDAFFGLVIRPEGGFDQ